MKLPQLHIGDLTASVPIIQGAMGVGVSRSGLAAAVANEGPRWSRLTDGWQQPRRAETRHSGVAPGGRHGRRRAGRPVAATAI